MVFIETSVFTRQVRKLLSDEEYQQLQMELIRRPDTGVIMPGSGGLRKVRWSLPGRGKRGGARVIYYWAISHDHLLMLLMYPKNEQENLTQDQVKVLRAIVESEYP